MIKINKNKKREWKTPQNNFVEIPPYNYYWSKNKRGEIHNELFDLVRIKRSTIYPEFRKRQRLRLKCLRPLNPLFY